MNMNMNVSTHLIKVLGEDKVFFLKEDKHLATHMTPEGCHGGGCGICKIKIIEGRYNTLPMSKKHVSLEEKEQGFALACRVFPITDLVIEKVKN